jgi:hypothetical protein
MHLQSFLLMRLSVVRPIETRKFIAVSRQYLSTEQEAIDMWRDVVSSINLSDKQKLEIVQWKQLFMQKVEPIVEERKKLNVQIQSHLPQVSPAAMLGCSRTSRITCSSAAPASVLPDKLQAKELTGSCD